MNKLLSFFLMGILVSSLLSCGNKAEPDDAGDKDTVTYLNDRFADVKIMRYTIPGWDSLTLDQKKLIYYLSEAAVAGRDIIFDQNYKHNLTIRRMLEEIYQNYEGDKSGESWEAFEVYLKRVWFSNGIHHHYAMDKFIPDFSEDYFRSLVSNTVTGNWPLKENEDIAHLTERIIPIIFDPEVDPKRVSSDTEKDLLLHSACNFYEGVTQLEMEAFYDALKDPDATRPVSYGLNSKLVKEDGRVQEKVYKIGGLYSGALTKVVDFLEKAVPFAESERQKQSLKKLIDFYQSGDLKTFDEFNVLWVQTLEPLVDFVNGFTEVYGDPMGMKATWESVVNFKNMEASKRTTIISSNAQWFEDHSPIDDRFKKKQVKGVSAKVITVAHLGGDCYPSTPIGINLPNADWIRKEYGSKSVTMDNITYAYDRSSQDEGALEAFSWDEEEVRLLKEYGYLAGNLHTDLHECLGHGSGQLLPGVSSEALKNYSSVLEEARADLFALYYIMDPKMVELGLIETPDVAKAEYIKYIRNGLMSQLRRIEPGKDIEQAHMRNRQLIAKWVLEKGKEHNVIERKQRDGKTFFVINDFEKLRALFGQLLTEVQRIKSEGDYDAGKDLVEKYAVKIDRALHEEVLERYAELNLAAFGGFVNPVFKTVKNDKGEIIDIKVEYSEGYTEQNLRYSKDYSFLPNYN